MAALPDWMIKRDIKIVPFAEATHRPGVISYGVSSYGYDVRVGRTFKIFTNVHCAVVDPKQFNPASFVDIEGDFCVIPPNSFALAETVEYLEIPRDVIAVCVGKCVLDKATRHLLSMQMHTSMSLMQKLTSSARLQARAHCRR